MSNPSTQVISQPIHFVGGGVGTVHGLDRLLETSANRLSQLVGHDFVGVDDEKPFVLGQRRAVAFLIDVAGIGAAFHARCQTSRDRLAPVSTLFVDHDDDFIGPGNGSDTALEFVFFVTCENAD